MKKIAAITILILLMNNFYAADNNYQLVTLTIIVDGIKKPEGQISIGLYNSKDEWMVIGRQFKGAFIKASDETISYSFNEIPSDTYAIAIFHDYNMNKILDKNILGIPKEGYAFSNNVFGSIGPPDYSKASFLLDENRIIQIKLKY